jgi:hypothetical protein
MVGGHKRNSSDESKDPTFNAKMYKNNNRDYLEEGLSKSDKDPEDIEKILIEIY